MRPEIQEVLQDKLESFVAEHLNDVAKNADGGCCGIHIANPELRYYKGYIDGMCCALKCKTRGLENFHILGFFFGYTDYGYSRYKKEGSR